MQQLDQPVPEQTTTEMGCGDPMPTPMPPMDSKPDTPPPSMSINLNAQGLENIEELMALIKAVNKDMDQPPMPTLSMEPSITSIKPSMPPLKMLPDLDSEPHMEPDGDEGPDPMKPSDNDGDEENEKKDKEEAFGNSLGDSEPETMGVDAATHDGTDLNRKKNMFAKAQDGDNAMSVESTDLRSQIRAELLRRLEEAKGAK